MLAPEQARIDVSTNHGDFSFTLTELRNAGRLAFIVGYVAAIYTPPVASPTRGQATQHDFTAATKLGEDLYVAWTSFHNEANTLYLGRLRDGAWKTWRLIGRTFGAASEDWPGRRYVAPEGERQSFPKATTDASGKP